MSELIDTLETPCKPKGFSNYDIINGIPIPAIDRLKIINEDDFEEVVLEWVEGYLRDVYKLVNSSSGAGDKGRDVVAYVEESPANSVWDNYQCKHYDHPLYPSDIWLELAKLCYYTFKNVYTIPRTYYFVSPQGVGPEVSRLIENPDDMRTGLIKVWIDKCQDKIIKGENIELDTILTTYINNFDFSIIRYIPPLTLIDQHSKTKWHYPRFGGGISLYRPEPEVPTQEIKENEASYVKEMFDAYSEHLRRDVTEVSHLQSEETILSHFNRQRENFYCAESLREFVKDSLPDMKPYDDARDEVFKGIIDICEGDHEDGFKRLKETTKHATVIQLSNGFLLKYIKTPDRIGICHQFVNEGRIKWVRK